MGAPSGDGDGGAGLLDVLNDIVDKLRKELNDKLDDNHADLSQRLAALEKETKRVDDDEQSQIDELKLMERLHQEAIDGLTQDIKVLKLNKAGTDDLDREIGELKEAIAGLASGKPVEIRASSPKGPKITQEDIDRWNAAADKADSLA